MRLVLATPLYPPELGGPATYAKLLMDGLPALGVEPVLVPFSQVRRFPKLVRHIAYYRKVLSVLKSADAVLALDPVSTGLPALRAAQHLHKPFFVKIVGDYAWEQGKQRFGITESLDEFVRSKQPHAGVRLLQQIQTRVAKRATRVIVPSNYLKGIVEAWGVPSEKIVVVRNSVDVSVLGKVPEEVGILTRPRIVTAGRLVPWKGIEGVIDAVSTTPLVIAGEGPEAARLEAYAKEKKSHVVFTGALEHEDLLATLAACDLFVLNSTYEGLSHLLLEAIALGVPTIATNVGGNPEAVQGVSYARLVPVGDTQALSSSIREMLTNPPEHPRPQPEPADRLLRETITALSV